MSQHNSVSIRKPRIDDRPLWDVLLALEGYPAVLVAHELKLFALLADKPLSLDEICAAKNLAGGLPMPFLRSLPRWGSYACRTDATH